MNNVTRTKLLAVGFVLLAAFGVYAARPKADADGWQPAASVAPPGLMEQVIAQHIHSDFQVDAGQMKVWPIQAEGQSGSLYLIDTRVADSAQESSTNPLCGAMGCAFLGYLSTQAAFEPVWSAYLNPHLPPGFSLIELTDEQSNGLPVFQVNQLTGDRRVEQLIFAFNGQKYEVIETRLAPQVHE